MKFAWDIFTFIWIFKNTEFVWFYKKSINVSINFRKRLLLILSKIILIWNYSSWWFPFLFLLSFLLRIVDFKSLNKLLLMRRTQLVWSRWPSSIYFLNCLTCIWEFLSFLHHLQSLIHCFIHVSMVSQIFKLPKHFELVIQYIRNFRKNS